jgi:hypothetical protein
MRQGVIIGAFALVSAVALAGWTRKPATPVPAYPAAAYAPAPVYPAPAYPMQQPYAGQYAPPQAYPAQAFTPLNQYGAPLAYAPVPQATTAVYERPVARPVVRRASYAPAPVRRVAVVQKKKRPFSHSAAIVGGSAGA